MSDTAVAGPESLKQRVRDFWNAEACGERYGDEQDRIRYELEPEIAEFARFSSARGLRLLEIGLGMGSDFIRFVEGGAIATGVDITERAVEITSDRLRGRGLWARLLVADAETLPFADNSFEVVYSWGVLHHTPNTGRAIAEAWRVLRPGGELRLMLYNRHSWVALAAWVRFGLLRGKVVTSLRRAVAHIESPGTQAFTVDEIKKMFRMASRLVIRPTVTTWDRRYMPGLAHIAPRRFGWFLLVDAWKPR